MSEEVTQDNSESKPKHSIKFWFALLFIVLVSALFYSLFANRNNPIYEGKRVSERFEEAVQNSLNSPYFQTAPFEPRIISRGDGEKRLETAFFDPTALEISQDLEYQVFLEIEGDAIKYLISQLDAKPSKFSERYRKIYEKLPASIVSQIPEPKDGSFYRPRNRMALGLLTLIGVEQRRKAEIGTPTTKTSIAVAIAKLRTLLKDPLLKPLSRPTGSTYYRMTDYTLDLSQVISAMGRIGPMSAPAVPDLISIAELPDSWRPGMAIGGEPWISEMAIRSLGNIGRAAYTAVPILVPLLDNYNQFDTFPGYALGALASIGVTPDEAVPQLETLMESEDEWVAILATVALWNRDLENIEFQNRLIAFLQTERKAWLLTILKSLGKNATPVADEIRLIAESPDSDPQTIHLAKAVLFACEVPVP